MKKLFNFKTLPIFFQSTKLGTVALLLLLVSLLSAFFAVLVNWVFGLIWLIVVDSLVGGCILLLAQFQ